MMTSLSGAKVSRGLLVISLFFCSCHSLHPALPIGFSGYPRNFTVADSDERGVIDSALRRSAAQIRTVRIRAQTKVHRGVGTEEFPQVVVFSRPDKLRIEFFVPGVNQLASIVVSNVGIIRAFDRRQMKGVEGEATLSNIERLLNVPFYPEEFMLWLCGSFSPPGGEVLSTEVLSDQTRNRYVYRYFLRGGRIVTLYLTKDNKTVIINGLDIGTVDKKNPEFQSEFFYSEQQTRPASIHAVLPKSRSTVDLKLENVVLNPDLTDHADRLFQLNFPPGAKVEELR